MSQLSENTESGITSVGSLRWLEDPNLFRTEAERGFETVAAVRAVSSTAFDELQRQYSRRLFSTIMRITKNREDAEDALQDTFLQAFVALPQFECRSSVYSWLTRIAINRALMILRRRRTRQEANSVSLSEGCDGYRPLEIVDVSPSPEQVCEVRQRCNRLVDAIQRLKPQLRAPIEIQLAHECSLKEIAKALNISLPAVKARLFRARAQLANRTPALEVMGISVLQ